MTTRFEQYLSAVATLRTEPDLREVLTAPEHHALKLYSRLSTTSQWMARRLAEGHRRDVLIQHHIAEVTQLR